MATEQIHASLRSGTNALLAAVWLAALVGLVMVQREAPWGMVSLGLVSGAVQGFLQQRALREGAERLREARTSIQVRAALMSTASGRAQIKVLWGSGAIYLVVAMLRHAPGPFGMIFAVLSAMLAQWFVRESMTVSACRQFEKRAA
jgi:hypothetical protein